MFFDFIRLGNVPPRTDRHRLAGVVTVNGLPAKRLITVVDRLTMTLLAAKHSDSTTGIWEITGLSEYPERRLLVLALDDVPGTYNAEVLDFISQVEG